MSAPSSDTSETPSLIEHPALGSSTASLSSTASPAPRPVTLKDTASETIAALAPAPGVNSVSGLGKTGKEQLDRLGSSEVFGGAQAVVGPAHGEGPEFVAIIRKQHSDGEEAHEREEGEEGEGAQDHDDGEGGDKHPPRWLRKVKEGVTSAASSLKEKAASAKGERSSSVSSGSGSIVHGRERTKSLGSRSILSGSASSVHDDAAPAPVRPTPGRVVTDSRGQPVPLEVGGAAAPKAVKEDDFASTATSVKDKILEEYGVEPKTTNEKFHSLFKTIPGQEELIEGEFSGKLYLSEHFLSFRANILGTSTLPPSPSRLSRAHSISPTQGWETSLQIPWSEIVTIEKRMTAKIIPNAIEVRTLHATHTFVSFIARDAAYDLLVAIWHHAHPHEELTRVKGRGRAWSTSSAATGNSAATGSAKERDDGDSTSEISFEDEKGEKKKHRFSLTALRHVSLKRDSASTADSSPTEAEKIKQSAQAGEKGGGGGGHPETHYDGPEYKNEALDCVIPTSPEKAYSLFFTNEEFLKLFLEEKEHLKEIDVGPWKSVDGASEDSDHALKERDMRYLKPLNAPVGPKETHCIIHDKNVRPFLLALTFQRPGCSHLLSFFCLQEKVDSESYISNVTTTKTPDVPSGDNFSVVTRTVFTWAEGGGCRVRVTTEVEWTKVSCSCSFLFSSTTTLTARLHSQVNRLLRGVIERGALDGQKTYHKDLEEAVRAHIDANKSEYVVATSGCSSAASRPPPSDKAAAAAASSAESSSVVGGFLDSLPLPVPASTFLLGLVVFLALTNFFTLLSLRSQAASARSARIGQPGEVASAVSRVLGEFNALHERRVVGTEGGVSGEVAHLKRAVIGLEKQVGHVVGQLGKIVEQVRDVADRTHGVQGML
ncbi:SPOSA6832_03306, partial [Sporobolomyces salmonicolor]